MFEPQSKRDEINRTNWQFKSPMTIDEFIEDKRQRPPRPSFSLNEQLAGPETRQLTRRLTMLQYIDEYVFSVPFEYKRTACGGFRTIVEA
jgi:hypothetical protein